MAKIFVKPAIAGGVILRPDKNRPLKPEGEWVPNSSHWRRCLRQGDVVVAQHPLDVKTPAQIEKEKSSHKAKVNKSEGDL